MDHPPSGNGDPKWITLRHEPDPKWITLKGDS